MITKTCKNPACENVSFCDKFCRKCGTTLVKSELKPADNFPCPICGASVFSHDNFCGTCGQDMSSCLYAFVFKHRKITIDSVATIARNPVQAWINLSKKTKLKIQTVYNDFELKKIVFVGFLKVNNKRFFLDIYVPRHFVAGIFFINIMLVYLIIKNYNNRININILYLCHLLPED